MNRSELGEWTRKIGFGVFAFTVFFAVLVFGATTYEVKWFAHLLLFLSGLFWTAHLLVTGTWNRLFRAKLAGLWLPVLWLIGHGFFMVLNAKSDHSLVEGTFYPWTPLFSPDLPGTVVLTTSLDQVWLHACMLVAIWVLAVQCRLQPRLLFVARILGTIGLVFAIVGLAQRVNGNRSIYGLFDKSHRFFFGPYRSHANAGTFILMIWPFCAALFLRELALKRRSLGGLIFWGSGAALLFVSLYVNVSRAAQVVGTFTFALFVLLNGRQIVSWIRWKKTRPFERGLMVSLVSICLLFGIMIGYEQSLDRWDDFLSSKYWPPQNTARWQAYIVEAEMVKDAGWFGHGPAAFKHLFPGYMAKMGDHPLLTHGVWYYGHQDYLQTALEWGACGALARAVLLFGSWGVCGWALVRKSNRFSGERILILRAVWIAMLGFFLHALVDQPFQIYSLRFLFLTITAIGWSCVLVRKEEGVGVSG